MIKNDKKYSLNRMNSNAIRNLLGAELHHVQNFQVGIYDFTVQGGAIGDIQLQNTDQTGVMVLPAGALITQVYTYVPVAVTSAGSATVAVKAASSADCMNATAKASLSLNAIVAGNPVDTAASILQPLAADTTPVITVAVAALTAGKMLVYFSYVLSSF